MPFVDDRQIRARAQLPGAEYYTETPWWDGYAASLGMVIDEELSISSGLHKDGWHNRHQQIRDLDIDLRPYTDRRGRVDYDTLASEYDLKTDAQLEAERAQMLATRREYAQDVLENAPASAQFLGAMNGYLLDPISIATMPLSYTAKGAQGLSVLSRIGRTAAKAAAIEGATELAIQSVVFDYKQEIDSPYAARDAITAIATAAAGASILAGGATGIAGYLKSVRQGVDPATLTKGELKGYESVMRMEEALEGVESPSYRVTDEYAAMQRGEYKSFQEAADASIARLDVEAKAIQSESVTASRYIAEHGGLNKAAWIAEGMDESSFKEVSGGFGNPVFRVNGGQTPDDLAELLNQSGYYPNHLTANDAVDIVDDMLRGGNGILDPEAKARFEGIRAQADALAQSTDDEYLSGIYKGAIELDIEAEAARLREMEAFTESYNAKAAVEDDFDFSYEARMRRAKEQGFDTDTVYYHGTEADFEGFKIPEEGIFGKLGRGVYLTESTHKAGTFGEGGSVIPAHVKGQMASWEDVNRVRDELNAIDPERFNRGHNYRTESVNEKLREEGFIGINAESEIVVFDPQNIRSVNAAFDPDYRGSNLLDREYVAPKAATASVESDVLSRTGLSDAYDATAAEYSKLENRMILDGDDLINADDLIKELDDELGGLDNVMRCVRG